MNVKKIALICMGTLWMMTLWILIIPGVAHADTTGTNGTCIWVIDDEGVLTISPADGVSGQLESNTSLSNDTPWWRYKSSITKVVVEPGVKAGAGCCCLFKGLTECTQSLRRQEMSRSGSA